MATGLPCEIVHWDNRWVNQSRFDRSTVEAIYHGLWLEPSITSWAQLFAAERLPDFVEDLFLSLFSDSFVIGFELPPYLVNFLNRQGIDFVDCSLSPVRFMDDLLFEVSASSGALSDVIMRYQVSDALIKLQAGVLSSNVAKVNPEPPRPNTLLLILQTRYDKAVIKDGCFINILEQLDSLQAIAQDYDHILIKQHPLEPQEEALTRLKGLFPGSAATTENFYRLVAHRNLAGVAALSSSCVLEATYFGKSGHYLLPGFKHGAQPVGFHATNVDDAIIAPDFWRETLQAAGISVTAQDGIALPPKANRFRQQLRSAWGYNQVDTDIAVNWAR